MDSSSVRLHRKRKRRSAPLILTASLIGLVSPCISAFHHARTQRHHVAENTLLYASRTRQNAVTAIQERDRTFDPIIERSVSRQFTPRYVSYSESKFMGKFLSGDPEIRTANPATLPTSLERTQLTEKISRLLSDESPLVHVGGDEQIADKKTVFAKLSDEDLRDASEAVATPTTNNVNDLVTDHATHRHKKGKLMANVMETGQDTIKQYVKSLANHQVLSHEDEIILGKQIQILSKWEERRLELESDLLRYVSEN